MGRRSHDTPGKALSYMDHSRWVACNLPIRMIKLTGEPGLESLEQSVTALAARIVEIEMMFISGLSLTSYAKSRSQTPILPSWGTGRGGMGLITENRTESFRVLVLFRPSERHIYTRLQLYWINLHSSYHASECPRWQIICRLLR